MEDIELEKRLGKIETGIVILTNSINTLVENLSEQNRNKDVWALLHSKEHYDFLNEFFDKSYDKKKDQIECDMIEVIEKWKNKTIVKAIATFIPITSIVQVVIYWILQIIF